MNPTGRGRTTAVWSALAAAAAATLATTAGTIGPVYSIRVRIPPPVDNQLLDDARVNVSFGLLHLIVIAIALAVVLAERSRDRAPVAAEFRRPAWVLTGALAVVHLTVFVSSSWSRVEGRSFTQAGLFLLTTLAAAALGRALTMPRLVYGTFVGHQVVLAHTLWSIRRAWPTAVDERGHWAGIFFNKNSLGPVAALGLLSAIAVVVLVGTRREWWCWALRTAAVGAAAADTVILLKADSITSIVGVVAGLAAPVLCTAAVRRSRARHGRAARAGGLVLLAAWAAAVLAVALGRTILARTLHRSPTLSGRTELWGWLFPRIGEKPWLGWGWLSVWEERSLQLKVVQRFHVPFATAHNGLIEMGLAAGVPGAVATLVVFLTAGSLTIRRYVATPGPGTAMAVGVVAYCVAVNQLETFVGANLLPWTLLVAVAVMSLRPHPAGESPDTDDAG